MSWLLCHQTSDSGRSHSVHSQRISSKAHMHIIQPLMQHITSVWQNSSSTLLSNNTTQYILNNTPHIPLFRWHSSQQQTVAQILRCFANRRKRKAGRHHGTCTSGSTRSLERCLCFWFKLSCFVKNVFIHHGSVCIGFLCICQLMHWTELHHRWWHDRWWHNFTNLGCTSGCLAACDSSCSSWPFCDVVMWNFSGGSFIVTTWCLAGRGCKIACSALFGIATVHWLGFLRQSQAPYCNSAWLVSSASFDRCISTFLTQESGLWPRSALLAGITSVRG